MPDAKVPPVRYGRAAGRAGGGPSARRPPAAHRAARAVTARPGPRRAPEAVLQRGLGRRKTAAVLHTHRRPPARRSGPSVNSRASTPLRPTASGSLRAAPTATRLPATVPTPAPAPARGGGRAEGRKCRDVRRRISQQLHVYVSKGLRAYALDCIPEFFSPIREARGSIERPGCSLVGEVRVAALSGAGNRRCVIWIPCLRHRSWVLTVRPGLPVELVVLTTEGRERHA